MNAGPDAKLGFARTVADVFAAHAPGIQFSGHQILVIAQALRSRGRPASLLVFGVGNDSEMWARINTAGRTVFLENNGEWLALAREKWPALEIHKLSYRGWTVATSLPVDPARLAAAKLPDVVAATPWDVIVVDSPKGSGPGRPGRAVSIYWASLAATPETDVFIDDANREVEATYAAHFFGRRRQVRVPRVTKGTKASSEFMIWALGGADAAAQA